MFTAYVKKPAYKRAHRTEDYYVSLDDAVRDSRSEFLCPSDGVTAEWVKIKHCGTDKYVVMLTPADTQIKSKVTFLR